MNTSGPHCRQATYENNTSHNGGPKGKYILTMKIHPALPLNMLDVFLTFQPAFGISRRGAGDA